MFHNVEANVHEYELLSELMNMIGCWFYDDVHIVVFHAFLKQKVRLFFSSQFYDSLAFLFNIIAIEMKIHFSSSLPFAYLW